MAPTPTAALKCNRARRWSSSSCSDDGAIRFVLESRQAIAQQDVRARTTAVTRALAIIAELQNTLNVAEGGDVARELDRLYSYMRARLLDVTAKADDEAAKEVHKLLQTLRDGWQQIAVAT